MNICVRAFAGFRIGELGKWSGLGFGAARTALPGKNQLKAH